MQATQAALREDPRRTCRQAGPCVRAPDGYAQPHVVFRATFPPLLYESRTHGLSALVGLQFSSSASLTASVFYSVLAVSDPAKWRTPRLKTIRAFEAWKLDEANWTELFRLIVEDRKRLRDSCVAMKVPYTLVYLHLHDGGAMQKRYESALAAVADDLAHEALAISDEQAEVVKEDGTKYDPDVPRDKLRVDTRLRMASKWGPGRYGDKESERGGGMTVIVDRSCGGSVAITSSAGSVLVTGGGVPAEREIFSTEASAIPAQKSLEKLEI